VLYKKCIRLFIYIPSQRCINHPSNVTVLSCVINLTPSYVLFLIRIIVVNAHPNNSNSFVLNVKHNSEQYNIKITLTDLTETRFIFFLVLKIKWWCYRLCLSLGSHNGEQCFGLESFE